jgi:hypothetical protein
MEDEDCHTYARNERYDFCKQYIAEHEEKAMEPKRGDRVLVWDDNEGRAEKRIYLANVGGTYPIISVFSGDESYFPGGSYRTSIWAHMKSLSPIKEMTVSEVSRALGYEVKIVKES